MFKDQQTEIPSYDGNSGTKETTLKAPTREQYSALDNAYNYFKKNLFGGKLTPVLITLNRRTHSAGYYRYHAWFNDSISNISQINISPSTLRQGHEFVFSVLVHEMVHHQQFMEGRTTKWAYHDMRFAELMEHVGLICSDTFRPGGKKIGKKMGHYVQKGGPFEKALAKMPHEYYVPFMPHDEQVLYKNTNRNKTTFCCNNCKQLAWAKPTANLKCGQCDLPMNHV